MPVTRGYCLACVAFVAAIFTFGCACVTLADDVPAPARPSAAAPDGHASFWAVGTLEPLDVVAVSASVTGAVTRVFVNSSDRVQAGQILAEIDDRGYALDLDAAKAVLQRAMGELTQAQVKYDLARTHFERQKELIKSGTTGPAEGDAGVAEIKLAEAGVAIANAAVLQSQVMIKKAELILEGTRIISPIAGVVLDRHLSVGQSVNPYNANPVLFQIASDLSVMQAHVIVTESLIARVHKGQPAILMIDAFPGRPIQGKVSSIRLNATREAVQTYTITVDVANSDQKLLPYMTVRAELKD
jgi:HlyD family secretion protein